MPNLTSVVNILLVDFGDGCDGCGGGGCGVGGVGVGVGVVTGIKQSQLLDYKSWCRSGV